MILAKCGYVLSLLCIAFVSCQTAADEETTRQQILAHGQNIRDAFAAGDLDSIGALHHPGVQKALSYNDVQNGRDAVLAGLASTLGSFLRS